MISSDRNLKHDVQFLSLFNFTLCLKKLIRNFVNNSRIKYRHGFNALNLIEIQ